MLLEKERQEIVDTCLFMQAQNLVVGTAGNVSVRVDDLVAISPSGVEYETMKAEDVVVLDMDGKKIDGLLNPSSEVPLHLSVYRNTAALAITHNHAPASTALGLVVDEIPLSHYYSAMFGGQIRVAPYANFGGTKLAEYVTKALEGRTGALMKNHGAITIGSSLKKAVNMLPLLEYICEIQLRAMWTGREVSLLDAAEMAEASASIKDYGKQPARTS